jgi:calcineurin-like phosphoesterase family protein
MSGLWFVSDLHFGHAAVIEHCKRPFWTVKDMDEALIDNWNRVVGKLDDVWILGDVSFHKTERTVEILQALKGRLRLTRGNHDKRLVKQAATSAVFQCIVDMHTLKVPDSDAADGKTQRIVMCHYAFRTFEKAHYGTWNLHGHSHGSLAPIGRQLDVGVDATAKRLQNESDFPNGYDYTPVSYDEVKAYMATRTFEKVDHHGSEP